METAQKYTVEFGGKEVSITIAYDTDRESPREWDNLGTMALFHRRYSLPNEDGISIERAQEIENDRNYICLPVYGYDHGGLTINTNGYSCPWDGGRLGIIYVHKDTVRREYGWKIITAKRMEVVESVLAGEVETFDQYLTGDVYGYLVEVGENHDSCWGFYGLDYCKEEAELAARCIAENN
jgi:hypothetical protein